MKTTRQLTMLAGSLLISSNLVWAAGNSITKIETLPGNGDQQVLAITLAKPALLPKSFALSNPPRIAFDFIDTGSSLAKTQLALPGPLLNNATIVAAGERSRVILSLAKNSPYQTRVEGNRILVTLGNVQQRVQPASITTPASSVPVATTPAYVANISGSDISLVDFRRGSDASGRVVIDLPNASSATDVSRSGKSLIINLSAPLPRRLERRLDVTDFGTPVQSIDASNQGKGSRVVLQNAGEWEFSSYQANQQLVVEVRKISTEQANAALMALGKTIYKGEKLSLNFQNVEVRALLQTLAEFAGFNLVTGDTVTGTMTLRLKDVPWDQALDIVLQQKGLAKRQVGNVIRIAPQADMIALAKQAAEAKEATTLQEPLITEVFQIKYRTVEEVMSAIAGLVDIDSKNKGSTSTNNTGNNNGLRASAYADAKTNQLVVREKPPVLDEIRAVLAIIDKPSKQVLIEARIVEVSDTFQRDLGVKLGFAKVGGDTSVGSGYGPAGGTPLPGGPATLPTTPNINLPSGLTGGNVGIIFKGASSIIGLELQAMQTQGKGKIVSSPRVLTADRTKAIIKEGIEIPYQSNSGDQGTTTSFKEANLVLDVTPQITPDNDIILDVQVNKDAANFLKSVNGEPSIDKREVKTQVRIGDGNTVVIGGIYIQDESDTVSKVPLLGDIPVLGHLFRSNSRKNDRRELLVFITPRIVESETLIR
ncbi:type IV pilus secretin PilQ [Craterilacuibacter sinensis]|uniref:Type IV pilus secretin PilQ n=1 Tax=Craterilacuibacter sinensis TaxID=2686017 RepID=A0A845BNF8_9NEIS|nr:type IV pilus secretin PilQ [Craterilacuibacter sinensis]MXR37952.1 type IV pilus secretin PilQ [Craterilacuibacter sinensis]